MDSEFRKPFEYKEEKRGFLILFIVSILVIDTLQTLSFATQEYKYLGNIPILGAGFLIIGALFIAYIIYTAIIVYRLKDGFVKKTKNYLIIRTIFSVTNFLIVFYNIITKEKLVGEEPEQYLSTNSMLIYELYVPLFYMLSFSVIWYLYFTFSRRCRGGLENV